MTDLEFNVSLFMADAKTSQTLTKILRAKGIFASYYSEPSTLVRHMNTNGTDLIIAEEALWNKYFAILENHPKIQDKDTVFALIDSFADQESQGLIPPVAWLSPEISEKQITSLVSFARLNKTNKVRSVGKARELRVIKTKYEESFETTEKIQKSFDQLKNVSDIIASIEKQQLRDTNSFLVSMAKVFDKWENLEGFGFYQLNQTGEKLVPIDVISKRYKKLPFIWIGKSCDNGIETFAQEMAYQVAFEELGVSTIGLRISGGNKYPDFIFFLGFTAEEFSNIQENFHWSLFETLLSNTYRSIVLQSYDEAVETQFLPIWDMLQLMDEVEGEDKYKALNIDLYSLNHFVAKAATGKFYWKTFLNDFLLNLATKLSSKTKVTTYGTFSVLLICPEEQLDHQFAKVKEFINSFEFWKYFSDTTQVVPKYVQPKVYLVSMSSSYYLEKEILGKISGRAHKLDENQL